MKRAKKGRKKSWDSEKIETRTQEEDESGISRKTEEANFDRSHLRPWQTRTLLPTHCCRHKCFPVCPRAQHLLRTQILCPGHKKCFWFCSETFCVRNNIRFVSRAFARPRNTMGNNVPLLIPLILPAYLSWFFLFVKSGEDLSINACYYCLTFALEFPRK